MIKESDITVIVSGRCSDYTLSTLLSIREQLPNAVLILSTWKNESYDKYLKYCDLIIKNDDPGALPYEYGRKDSPYLNINRMLYSRQQALKYVETKYCLMLRTDALIVDRNFLTVFGNYPRKKEKSLFREKILTIDVFSMKYEGVNKYKYSTPFHVSDMVHFGLLHDLKILYDIGLVDLEKYARYFEWNRRPLFLKNVTLNGRLWKYPPEEYLTYNYYKKVNGDIGFDSWLDFKKVDSRLVDSFVVNNFIIHEARDLGIIIQKQPFKDWIMFPESRPEYLGGLYTNYTYNKDYNEYCGGDISVINENNVIRHNRIRRKVKIITYKIIYIIKPIMKKILLRITSVRELLDAIYDLEYEVNKLSKNNIKN